MTKCDSESGERLLPFFWADARALGASRTGSPTSRGVLTVVEWATDVGT